MLRGEEWLDARKLFESGVTITEIASRLGHDRKTIRRCLSGDHPPVADRRHGGRVGSVLDPYKSYILQRMDFGVLNAVRLFREIRPMGYEGGLTTLRDFMRPHRPLAQAKVTRRFETPPGKQAQIDLGAFRYLASDEKVRTVYCFAMVLSFSRMLYVEFIERADQMGILTAMRRAFEFFGGVCEEILSDNCSPLVLSNDGEGNVVWQEAYLDFARHFGFIPRACRPYRARTKRGI
ncbi:MAG: IS21 family transposase [Bacillota bacterium]